MRQPNSAGVFLILFPFLVTLMRIASTSMTGAVVGVAVLALGCALLWAPAVPNKRKR